MASSQDIRAWAEDQGIELNPKGPIRKAVKDLYAEANPVVGPQETPPGDVIDGEIVTELAPTSSEAPPRGAAGKRKLFTRKPKEPTSTRRGARASTESLFSGVWTLAANLLGSTGNAPVARVLQFQAPVAGALLDRELRGTKADTMVQPVARLLNKGSNVGALVALPLMVQIVSTKPELYPMLKPHMVEAMYKWYEIAGPEMEKQQKRMEQRKTQLGGVDPEEVLNMIFAVDVPDATAE